MDLLIAAEGDKSASKGDYFWPRDLHEEFMRHFTVWGKTWKMVSQKMTENGITNKDQLQCRTHGQKYLLSLEEIEKTIKKQMEGKTKQQEPLDKKIYQKIQRYEEDKRYLLKIYNQDQAAFTKEKFGPPENKNYKPLIEFQDEQTS